MGLIQKFTRASPHLKIALVVAPLLAVGGYIAAGLMAPEPAEAPDSGALQVDPSCRLLGGVCRLLHREIAVSLGAQADGDGTLLFLRASVPVKGALVARGDAAPVSMNPREGRRKWQARLPYPLSEGDTLHLALSANGRRYYAEIPVHPSSP